MTCRLWIEARGLLAWIGTAGAALLQASPAPGIYVDFAAAVPSGAVYAGVPVELIATLKVTSRDGVSRDALLHQRGFNPRVLWKAQHGAFTCSATGAVLGDSTRPPNGLVFVCRGTYVPPPLPGEYTISVSPEADPGKVVTLKILVEDLLLQIHPSAVTLAPGQDQPFTVTFHGPPSPPLSWTTTGGSVSSQGVYRAPSVPGVHTVTVQHAPSGKKASALITVANTFSIQPASLELATGQTARFQCAGGYGPVSWSVRDSSGGTITPDGVYTAPRKPGTYAIQAAQSSDPARKATATVRVTPLTLSISPPSATLGTGQRVQFEAHLSQGRCLWSATQGTISEDGLYQAPFEFGTYHVIAASALDPEVRAMATINVSAMGLIQVVPEELTLHVGQTQQFMVPGLMGNAVPAWLVQPPWAGTITEDGLFTAGSTPGVCSIMALLEENVSTVSVNLIDTRVLPDPAQVKPGASLQFTAQGLPENAPVSWTLLPASAGTISSEGLCTAGNKPGTCRVSASAGGVEASAALRILATRISPEEVLVAPGGTVHFTGEAFDSPDQTMTWRLLGDQPGAFLGQDGSYRAPTRQGVYYVSAANPSGNAAQAKVLVGSPNGLIVTPEISVEQEGMYTVWVRLKASNGRCVDGNFTGEFQRGLAYPEIVFPARQMLNPLGVDGPYTIARVSVNGSLDDETVVFDAREDLGLTEAFSIEEATKEWLRIGEISEIKGQDRDANGLLASLLVTIPVECVADGDYRIQASLTTEDGTEIDTFSATQALTRGTNAIAVLFDGRKIHDRGSTGPLSIAPFAVEGPVARSRNFPGGIKGYDSRMFRP